MIDRREYDCITKPIHSLLVPDAPRELKGVAENPTSIQVSWSHPDITYGILGMYRVTYKGLVKDMAEVGLA